MEKTDTIAAVATPPGSGGIAIIRLSGSRSLDILFKLSGIDSQSLISHKAYPRNLYEGNEVVDSVIFLPMLQGRSYTGEEVVEIHCHGGTFLTQRILDIVLRLGARAAEPGEFTLRAFLNGKMDLLQAESVQEVIASKNQLALKASEAHLQGRLSKKIRSMQDRLADLVAVLEAWLDFPEEGLEYMGLEELIQAFEGLKKEIQGLIESYDEGRILREGIKLCLLGCPNVGKSSLMNNLLDTSRAIVTDIPGTTRDVIEEEMRLKHLHVKLIDTAGIRETDQLIEREGIKRSLQKCEEADVVLWVMDLQKGCQEGDQGIQKKVDPSKTLIVWNKMDCSSSLTFMSKKGLEAFGSYAVSAKTGQGIETLKEGIASCVLGACQSRDEDHLMITQSRHKDALQKAKEAIVKSIEGLKADLSPELIAFEAREALQALGHVIGMNISEQILASIFSKFCIGK